MVSPTSDLEEDTREWSYDSPISATRRKPNSVDSLGKRSDAPIRRTPIPPAPELPSSSKPIITPQGRVVMLSVLIGALGMALLIWALG